MKQSQKDTDEHDSDFLPEIRDISELETIYDRKKLLQITSSLIEETHTRISGERFRPSKADTERLAYIRLLRELIILHANLLKESKAPEFNGIPKDYIPIPRTPEQIEYDRKWSEAMGRMISNIPEIF